MDSESLLLRQAENARQQTNTDNIPGWGMDANPENDPAYPMKVRNLEIDHVGMNYEKAPQQVSDVKVFHSNERPGLTRVFGTTAPPKGLSGRLRAYAFRYSEATATHWMTLVLADRVNMVEGIIEDISHGKVPNVFAELGWRAEWEYNRKKFLLRLTTYAVFATSLVVMMRSKRKLR